MSGEMYHQGIQNIKNAKQRREVYRLKGQQQKKSSNSQLLLIDITSITSVRSHEIFVFIIDFNFVLTHERSHYEIWSRLQKRKCFLVRGKDICLQKYTSKKEEFREK